MKKRNNSLVMIGIFIFCTLSSATFAANMTASIEEAIPVGAFAIGVGSSVNLETEHKKLNGPSLFLGNVVKADGTSSYQMYLNQKSKTVYYIDSSNFRKNSKQQLILDSVEQAGGTCAAYAIDQFMIQTHLAGFAGTGELARVLSTEEGRSHLLATSINEYYLNINRRFSTRGILDGFGKKFGFNCKYLKPDNYDDLKEKMLSHLSTGSPVIVSFSIGPKMVNSPFALKMFDSINELDERLWIPRKIGERNSGGHSIVAAASFEENNKTYLVMLDSDWSEPRIWDMDEYLNQKTDLTESEFVTCK